MKTAYLTVNDRGKYHDQKIEFTIRKEYDEDDGTEVQILMIKYGKMKQFIPCGVYYLLAPQGFVYVAAANVGYNNDITLSEMEFIAILEKLGSSLIDNWKQIFKNNKKVAA